MKKYLKSLAMSLVCVSTLSGCYRTKTQTISIKPDPCKIPTYPEFPDARIHATEDEDKWILYDGDYRLIVTWINQVYRYREFVTDCPWVQETAEDELLPAH